MTQCYSIARTILNPSYLPCSPSLPHSPCCQLNHTTPDVCLSTGLCLSTRDEFAGTIWGNGCTDRDGADAACPQICKGLVNTTEFWNVMQCPEEGKWCCREWASWESCCGDPGRVVSLRSRDATERVVEDEEGAGGDHGAFVGGVVGGVMGLVILGLMGVIFWLWRMRRSLRENAVSDTNVLPPPTKKEQDVRSSREHTSRHNRDADAVSKYPGRAALQEVDGKSKNGPAELYSRPVELEGSER